MLKVTYGLLDITAADDAISSAIDVQPFSNPQEINTPDLDRLAVEKFATLEQNHWVLDGSFLQWPENPESETWGFWSKQISDQNGYFAAPVELTILFNENHSTEGLTMYFREDTLDYPSEMTIEYYNSANQLVTSKDFTLTEPVFFADCPAADYQKIVIIFKRTSLPYSYAKLSDIKYGSIKIFGEDGIISASILEEIDPTKSSLSVNTMECTIYTSDFQLLDPTGIYEMLQQKQAINITSTEDNISKDYGTFFLEEPTSRDDDTTTLYCVDFLGVIDKTTFMGGIYENKNAGELFDEIMLSAEVKKEEYQIEDSLRNKVISGWVPICTHREALQHWGFATGATIDCSRTKIIKAYSDKTDIVGTITHDDKFIGHKVKLKPLVTGVSVTAHKYSVDSNAAVAFEGTLPAGTNIVTFDAPYANVTATTGIITSSGANYAVVEMPTAGQITISGNEYVDNTTVLSVNASELPANAKPNVLTVDEQATLINADNALEIAWRIYNYYQNRYEDEGDFILNGQKVSELWRMNSLNNRDIEGRIERLEIDLVTEVANITMSGISAERVVE